MKPASFNYHKPENLIDALRLLEQLGGDAKVIAGGQSLVPMMNMRLARPEYLVDINQLKELIFIKYGETNFEVGALTRQYQLEEDPVIQNVCPILAYAVGKIGHHAIRQRGTVGGSLTHADPSAELPLLAALLDATFHVVSVDGKREIPAEEFFLTIYTPDLMPNEILTSVKFPILSKDEGWGYNDFSRRTGDFAVVSVAATLKLDDAGQVENMRMALGGVDMVPLSLRDKIPSWLGVKPDDSWIQQVVKEATSNLELGSDIHASSEDRLELLNWLIPKTIKNCLQRTKEKRVKENE